ncbi:exodeoxyribonuclease VII small subunit [Acetobacteroides hydrogenigenes]|uniref:Exodeoxyribonuclease VII small subunit n=1 Tax=Acetobacteroides hydrogenigenes TaxID=979970 RepID=A0A4R2EY92_9BACT|nr:exodeoxyribonuclease VII small subunit [Acetobacteroides hydrogenigenes]TCN72887.1 exodeoxyribonuclease VII small subunit [Acetobacteroides hydrogenigenes]
MAKKELTYSAALYELKEILTRIEEQNVNIDQIAEDVKRASELIKFCKEKLRKTEGEVDGILKGMKEQ